MIKNNNKDKNGEKYINIKPKIIKLIGILTIFIIVFLIITLSYNLYTNKDNKLNITQNQINEIEKNQSEIEKKINLEGIEIKNKNRKIIKIPKKTVVNNLQKDIRNSTGEIKKEVNDGFENIIEELKKNEKLNIDELKQNYSNAVKIGDSYTEIESLKEMYSLNKNKELILIIINKLLEDYRFEEALEYIKEIYAIEKDNINNINHNTFLYTLFNSMILNDENINKISKIVKEYHKNGYIDDNDLKFYSILLDLCDLKFSNLNNVQDLTGAYANFKNDINSAVSTFNLYKDSETYYLHGLIAYELFKNGYFKIAQKISTEITKINGNYILPYQILAYSYFLMNKSQDSENYFKKLIKIDNLNNEMYKFFLGINYFNNQKYIDSIVFLNQVSSIQLLQDSYRYIIMAYYKLGSYDKMLSYLSELLKLNKLNTYDYYTIFDIFFYKPREDNEPYNLLEENIELLTEYISNCYEKLSEEDKFVCVYGKAGFYLSLKKDEKALKYLLFLTDFYPRSYIFEKIGDIYNKDDEKEKAKDYYIKSILYYNNEEKKQNIKLKLIDLLAGE